MYYMLMQVWAINEKVLNGVLCSNVTFVANRGRAPFNEVTMCEGGVPDAEASQDSLFCFGVLMWSIKVCDFWFYWIHVVMRVYIPVKLSKIDEAVMKMSK